MERPARERIGRPRVTRDRRGFEGRYKAVLERLTDGDISRRRAAKELGIGYATLKRLLDKDFPSGYSCLGTEYPRDAQLLRSVAQCGRLSLATEFKFRCI